MSTTRQNVAAAVVLMAICMLLIPLASAAEMKIAYVDPQKVFANSKVGKAATKELAELEARLRENLDKLKSSIDAAEQELEKQYLTLSPSARSEREEKIRQDKIDLKRRAEDADRELSKLEKDYLERIDREVMTIIQEFGKERGYTLILGKVASVVLFADESIDVSEEVIRRYDAVQK